MVIKKQLLFELMKAALNEDVTVKDFVLEPAGVGSETAVAAKSVVCGVKTKLLYGQAGDNMTLWLAHGAKCSDGAAANAAVGEYAETPLGQKFCAQGEVNGEEGGLLLSYSFPCGSEDENIAALQEIFALFSDPVSAEKLSVLMRCFA